MHTSTDLLELYKNVVEWFVPVVLLGAIKYLADIAKQLTEISKSLAVVVTQIEAHEDRISRLEDKVLG